MTDKVTLSLLMNDAYKKQSKRGGKDIEALGFVALGEGRDIKDNGYQAQAYVNPKSQTIVLSIAGSNGDAHDLAANVNFGAFWEQYHPQFHDNLKYANDIRQLVATDSTYQDYRVITVGHSLGGGLAQTLTHVFGWHGITWDAPKASLVVRQPGFQKQLIDYGLTPKGAADTFINYTESGSLVSALPPAYGDFIGQRYEVDHTSDFTLLLGLPAHAYLQHRADNSIDYFLSEQDANVIDGWHYVGGTYDGWYSTAPRPEVGQFDWVGPASAAKNAALDLEKTRRIEHNQDIARYQELLIRNQPAESRIHDPVFNRWNHNSIFNVAGDGALTVNAPYTPFDDLGDLFDAEERMLREFNAGWITAEELQAFQDYTLNHSLGSAAQAGLDAVGDPGFLDFLQPIGAFYDSQSPEFDQASSIAQHTGVLLDGSNAPVSEAGLQALDTDGNGELSLAESTTLTLWQDRNEDGHLDAGEQVAVSRPITAIDYPFHTRGNAHIAPAIEAEPARPNSTIPVLPAPLSTPGVPATSPGNAPVTAPPALANTIQAIPASNYRSLRGSDNVYYLANGRYILWGANQIKINYNNRAYLIGTDGNDRFDANYYAAYAQYFNLNLLTRFLAGNGDDLMGGSARADSLWGGLGHDILLGYAGNDKLYGESGQDQLQGQDGNDYLDGGDDNDALFGQDGDDVLHGGSGQDRLDGGAGGDTLDGGTEADTLLGGTGDDTLAGGAGADELQGNEGHDRLLGGAGADRLFGQVGNDTLWGGAGDDLLMGFTGTNEAKQTLAAGETDDDTLYGGAGNDQLYGGLGQDRLIGGSGDDTLDGGEHADQLWGESGADTLHGRAGNDTLDGGTEADTLLGGTGDDTLAGGAGADELQGNEGHDRLLGGADADRLFGQVGNDTLWGGDGDDLLMGFTGTNEAKQTLAAGETDDDTLHGGAGHDNLYGGLGADRLDGGEGNDILLGNAGHDRLWGAAGNDELQGNQGDDQISGGAGQDRLFGQVGDDTLWGGTDSDLLVGFTASNEAQQTLAAGETDNDTLYGGAGGDFLLGGLGNDRLHGGDDKDELQGGDGADRLYGEHGDDNLFGQVGDDVLYGGEGDDFLMGFTASNEWQQVLIDGQSDNDHLYGGAGRDTLLGGPGRDYLDGGAGADEMAGGAGDDTYIVNSVNDSVHETANAGYDRVITNTHYLLNAHIEELRLLEGFAIHGTGNAQDNTLIGNSADNILDGVTGADTLIGGAGDDTYYVDNSADVVEEHAGQGLDTVQSSIDYALGGHVENLILLDYSTPEKGRVDGREVLVYGYPKRNELDYLQGDAVQGYAGTCALTAIANLLTQSGRPTSENEVVTLAIANNWAVNDPDLPAARLGGSNVSEQRAILDSYGIANEVIGGYNEAGMANLLRGGRAVILAVNAGVLWDDAAYAGSGAVNHAVTVTGAVHDADTGVLLGFYIADSGRGRVSDHTRFINLDSVRRAAAVSGAYAIHTRDPVRLWDEDLDATGNAAANLIVGNRGHNRLDGLAGDDTLRGQAGSDVLAGGAGADHLDGGAGNDTLYGAQGDDRLYAGAGNNWLDGGAGSDMYFVPVGEGRNVLADSGLDGLDQVLFEAQEPTREQLHATRVGGDLELGFYGRQGEALIKDWAAVNQNWEVVVGRYSLSGDNLLAYAQLSEQFAAPDKSAFSETETSQLAGLWEFTA